MHRQYQNKLYTLNKLHKLLCLHGICCLNSKSFLFPLFLSQMTNFSFFNLNVKVILSKKLGSDLKNGQ
jgi:hypothetical protein